MDVAFSLEELRQLKGQEIRIILEDDNPIFKQPYRLNEVEWTLVQAWTIKLLDVGLVELSKGEYASTTLMLAKDIFGNWTKHCMCGDYRPMNKQTHSNKYAMSLLVDFFYAFG